MLGYIYMYMLLHFHQQNTATTAHYWDAIAAALLHYRFRRLALKHHPDADPSEASTQEFSRICEAYDVLSSGMQCLQYNCTTSTSQFCTAGSMAAHFAVPLASFTGLLPRKAAPADACCTRCFAAKNKGVYDLYGENVLKSTSQGKKHANC